MLTWPPHQGRLNELAGLYADGATSAREWITARDPITTRIQQTRDRITQITDTAALHHLPGTGHALHQQWGALTLGLRQAIVQTILDHAVITPGTPGARSLDINRVQPHWRI